MHVYVSTLYNYRNQLTRHIFVSFFKSVSFLYEWDIFEKERPQSFAFVALGLFVNRSFEKKPTIICFCSMKTVCNCQHISA